MKAGALPISLLAAALLACAGEAAGPGAADAKGAGVRREAGLDVLLITVDTLRADALGAYGNARAATPWMDRLAAAGVRFDNAHAHNVVTLPSHASILSGLHPHQHGVRDNSGFRFPPDVATLTGTLRRQGYRTGAFVSAFPLDSRFGLDRDFEVYEDSFTAATARPAFLEQERPGPETVALARRWLAAGDGRPSFCWVHLYEPHYPYAPPEPFAGRFRDAPYHGDVAAADAALAPLLEPLIAAAEDGRMLVVLTSDHGESLGEHGEATHGIFAYEATLAVPLVLYQPRLFPPSVVTAPARLVDVLPTVLDALELPAPADLPGRSLLPEVAGAAGSQRSVVYFEALSGQLNRGWAPLYGVIAGGWKYIALPIPELYALDRDPRELENLALREPRRLAELDRLLEQQRAGERPGSRAAESGDTRRRLEALGYVSGAAAPRGEYTEADDPKRLIGLDAVLRQVAGRYAAGDLAGALELCRELVRRRPGMRMALMQLAQLERESGDLQAAVETMRQAFALDPGDPATLALLAAYLTRAGQPDEAVEITEPHARLESPDVEVLLTRALALARSGRPDAAQAAVERARELDPDNPMVAVHRGTLHLMGGDRDRARAAYEEALTMNPSVAAADTALAVMAIEEGRVDEALERWRRALAGDPREYGKLLAVGRGLWQAGRRDAARPLLELFAASAPASYRQDVERVRAALRAG